MHVQHGRREVGMVNRAQDQGGMKTRYVGGEGDDIDGRDSNERGGTNKSPPTSTQRGRFGHVGQWMECQTCVGIV